MKYYPIGTVIMLKNGRHPAMIYGRKQARENDNKIWDYVACLYPEGNLGDEYNIFFMQGDIGRVCHMGLVSIAEEKMQKVLAG